MTEVTVVIAIFACSVLVMLLVLAYAAVVVSRAVSGQKQREMERWRHLLELCERSRGRDGDISETLARLEAALAGVDETVHSYQRENARRLATLEALMLVPKKEKNA